MFTVYALHNRDKDKIYIGHTINLEKRLLRHNQLLPTKSKSYTSKNKGYWECFYQEFFETRTAAMKREKELKSSRGKHFIKTKLLSSLASLG